MLVRKSTTTNGGNCYWRNKVNSKADQYEKEKYLLQTLSSFSINPPIFVNQKSYADVLEGFLYVPSVAIPILIKEINLLICLQAPLVV